MLTSGLNDIFHLFAHSDIFFRSLFSTSAEVSLLLTIENREVENKEVSSAKSFTVDSMFSDKSCMYIRKKSRPRIDTYGTLDFAGNHSKSDHWINFWTLFV